MIGDDTATPITSADADTMADFGATAPPAEQADSKAAEAPPPSREELQAKDVEAFTKAVEEVSAKPDTKTEPSAKVDTAPAAKPAKADAQPAVDADPVAAQKSAEKAAVDAEVAKLNDDLKAGGHKPLTKAAEERFRELASRPKPEAVEAMVAPLRQQAERMDKWDNIVAETKATGEQLQTAMQYIAAYNSGDPKLMSQAADLMFNEVANMFKSLGRELPGAIDPLEGHADLAQAVEAGDITRKFALETAKARATEARTSEQNQRQAEEQQFRQAETDARGKLNQLGATLHQADAAQYLAKYPALIPAMKVIRETMHPSQWEAAVFRVYQELPYTPAAVPPPPKPHVGSVPMRPTGGNGAAMRAAVPADPVKAFMHGVESVR